MLGWNRGLGDIALGLYAMVQRIHEIIPDAAITFVTRENLKQGFSMLEGVKTIVALDWKRGQPAAIDESLKKQFDLIIENPSPTDWVQWQRGRVVPRLKWERAHDGLCEKFPLSNGCTCIGVQIVTETNHGPWRNWPLEKWKELFDRLEKLGNVKVLLFGFESEVQFTNKNIVDLRGKTDLFELVSIIKNRCHTLIVPDSGIASIIYYLDASFPLRLVTLWADPYQGILKQRVPSPNAQLIHCPLIGERRDLSTIAVKQVFITNTACIILAGGEGTRLGLTGPKGTFLIGEKSLFQRICEKVPDPKLPLAVMTSPLNHDETVDFFKKNHFFGLEVHFFQQEMHPCLDDEKQPISMESPNGNGSVFRSFVKSGIAAFFAKRGIDLIIVMNVDNPLADPFDFDLIVQARAKKAEAVVQCIERTALYPSMGMVVKKADKLKIVEYTDLDAKEQYTLAYTGQMAFDFSFFCKMADISLPLHWVRKKVDHQWVWKREQFIFDVLPFTSRGEVSIALRETCYAPLKSREDIALIEKLLRGKR